MPIGSGSEMNAIMRGISSRLPRTGPQLPCYQGNAMLQVCMTSQISSLQNFFEKRNKRPIGFAVAQGQIDLLTYSSFFDICTSLIRSALTDLCQRGHAEICSMDWIDQAPLWKT